MIDLLPNLIAAAAEVSHGAAESGTVVEKLASTFHVEWHLLLAQGINFIVVAFVLWKFAFKPVVATLETRKKKIEDGLQYAEEMKARLAEAEKQYAEKMKEAAIEGAQIIEEARENAKTYLEKQTQEAVTKAEGIVAKGRESVELERKQMLSELRREVAHLVVQTSGKVLNRDLSAEEKSRFNETAAKELYGKN
ncbi:F0F1 ATP synthase subunit B [Ruficoccus amylovorans]|uniref:ATP synthase subunit b n=1 Tax=Ruficoccus amylovorans TaxID=1804625 RepID=A0A842HIV1_9BACT|nr:F0F1 ATP synthase subunit B [Ruficoccus amylovorans]MBC2595516.1 F0F1 ATP synthase subunit B [Ruficoccus amylovorans]